MIRCEVKGCTATCLRDFPSEGWSQIGRSARFVDAPSGLASYCPEHEEIAKARIITRRELREAYKAGRAKGEKS